ncbi:efflux RND transporter periplasmic adaptor subunit [Calothrix sp. 336/3]|uniref:efflux RND transporter periplasmic adaptor subunit n=1 Tax=Calothrix sp. 336/3 TaxID=1337936 RepID=UPI0004E401C2|nr:efflux RND transporter periplasmic adaptor subunit [Calothrix sp. 336/3]AKG22338.1 RND transporter [Calothrix sp. 336/3]
MTTYLEIPFLGKKIKHPWRWFLGLVVGGTVITASTINLVTNNQGVNANNITELTVPVKSQNITLRITASGRVLPVQNVNISPKNMGTITHLYVEQGDRVKAGQIIARMDNADIQARIAQMRANITQAEAQLARALSGSRPEEIAQAKARLAQAEAQLTEARAGNRSEDIAQAQADVVKYTAQLGEAQSRLALASQRVKRRQFPASQGAVSQDYLDEALTEERNAKDNVKQVEASLTSARQELAKQRSGFRVEEIARRQAAVTEARESLKLLQSGTPPEDITQRQGAVSAAKAQLQSELVNLDNTVIRAPFEGIITQKYANVGAFVAPTTSASSSASATSSSVVALARGLEVLAQVPEADIGRIKQGQRVEIIADAYPDQVFQGRVRLIAPEAVKEEGVTLFQIRVAIDTGKDKLRSGLNVDLTFLGDKVANALLIPTVAIVTEKGETGILVPDSKNQPQFRPVTVGAQLKDQTQIIQGVQAGDRVFLSPPEEYRIKKMLEEKK